MFLYQSSIVIFFSKKSFGIKTFFIFKLSELKYSAMPSFNQNGIFSDCPDFLFIKRCDNSCFNKISLQQLQLPESLTYIMFTHYSNSYDYILSVLPNTIKNIAINNDVFYSYPKGIFNRYLNDDIIINKLPKSIEKIDIITSLCKNDEKNIYEKYFSEINKNIVVKFH